jgi:hypothetical protein
VLYVLLAGAIEFGRLMFDASALQDVVRVAARELAIAPIRADATFEYALSCDAASDPACLVDLKARVFDPACLVVDFADPAVSADPDGYFASMPIVNRALRPLMITEPARPTLMRYAGALLNDATGAACSAIGPSGQAAPTGLTVGIPFVEARDANGSESITWVPVLEEIRAAQHAACPARGPFSLIYLASQDECGPLDADPLLDRGLAAVRITRTRPLRSLVFCRRRPPASTRFHQTSPTLSPQTMEVCSRTISLRVPRWMTAARLARMPDRSGWADSLRLQVESFARFESSSRFRRFIAERSSNEALHATSSRRPLDPRRARRGLSGRRVSSGHRRCVDGDGHSRFFAVPVERTVDRRADRRPDSSDRDSGLRESAA